MQIVLMALVWVFFGLEILCCIWSKEAIALFVDGAFMIEQASLEWF